MINSEESSTPSHEENSEKDKLLESGSVSEFRVNAILNSETDNTTNPESDVIPQTPNQGTQRDEEQIEGHHDQLVEESEATNKVTEKEKDDTSSSIPIINTELDYTEPILLDATSNDVSGNMEFGTEYNAMQQNLMTQKLDEQKEILTINNDTNKRDDEEENVTRSDLCHVEDSNIDKSQLSGDLNEDIFDKSGSERLTIEANTIDVLQIDEASTPDTPIQQLLVETQTKINRNDNQELVSEEKEVMGVDTNVIGQQIEAIDVDTKDSLDATNVLEGSMITKNNEATVKEESMLDPEKIQNNFESASMGIGIDEIKEERLNPVEEIIHAQNSLPDSVYRDIDFHGMQVESFSRGLATTSPLPYLKRPLVLSGPSAVGIHTLVEMLTKKFPDSFHAPLQGISRDDLHAEYDLVRVLSEVDENDKICVIGAKIEHVKKLKQSQFDPYYVFISPPSLKELERRAREKGIYNDSRVREILERAKVDIAYGKEVGSFHKFIVNDELLNVFTVLVQKLKIWYPDLPNDTETDSIVNTCMKLNPCVIS